VANDCSFDPSHSVKIDDDAFADLAPDRANDRDAAGRNVDRPAWIFAPVGQHIATAKRHSDTPVAAMFGSVEIS
jgi:hypothetical protein